MKKFKDFEIVVETKLFIGDKIKISKVLNRPIIVHGFRVEDSQFNKGKCLCLQIEFNNTKHIIFTGSSVLLESIQKVPTDGFPFESTIVEENEMYLFT